MSGRRTEASAPTDDKKCGKTGRRGRRPLRIGCKRCGGRATARVAPTEGLQEVRWEESPSHGFAVPAPFRQGGRGTGGRIATGAVCPRNDTLQVLRGAVDREGRPYGGVTRGAGERATARVAPTEGHASISYTYIIKQYFFAMSRKFFAAEVNLRQRKRIFRWDWEGCGPEKSSPAATAGARGQAVYGRFLLCKSIAK